MKKRLISLVTVLTLVIALMPQTAFITSAIAADWSYPDSEPSEPYTGGTGTQDDPYTIETPQQFANFAYMVDNSKASSNYYKLIADIDLGGVTFNSIGKGSKYFWGHFDGDGYTIKGLNISSTSDNYQALFYRVSPSASVENLNVQGSVTGSMASGGIAAYNDGTVRKCSFKGTVKSSTAHSKSHGTGGIVAINSKNAVIEGCTCSGTVTAVDYIGGIVGYNAGTVSECSNRCDIVATATNTAYTGGIVGYNDVLYQSGKYYKGLVQRCSNTGSINASGGYAGGITGFNNMSSQRATVENCYNTGAVSGTRSVGGIAGQNAGYLNYCYNTGKVTLGGGSYGGGVIGNSEPNYSYSTYVKNCYYLEGTYTGGIAGTDYIGSAEKITASQMAAQETFVDWDFADIWAMDKTMAVLQWEQTQKAKEIPTVTAPVGKTDLVYTGEAQELLASAAATTGGTLQYKVDGGEYSADIPKAVNAGDHTVFYKVVGDDNYEDVEEASITVSIEKADQTVPKPTAVAVKPLSVTLTALDGGVNGVKYAVSEENAAPADTDKWQDSVTFTDLTKATTYYFFAKYLGDANHNEAVSEGVEITTADHTHEWEYTVSGTTIIAECKNTDGACSDTDGGSVTLTAPAESLVYNTESHNATVNNTLTTGDTVTVKYEYKASAEGEYAETTTTVNAGYYKALVTLDADKMVFVEYAVNKQTVTAPTISSKTYTGTKLAADIAESEYYTVTKNNGGIEKGNYDIILTLNDADNYKWSDGDENAAKTLIFTITETENEWITEPSVSGCIYGETVTVSNGAAKFGTVIVTYTGMANDNTQYSGSEPPTKAGSYTATFTVEGTASYGSLSAAKNFNIEKANQNKPSAPAASVTGTNSITLSEIAGGSNGTEYAASASSEAPESGWQDSAEFTGLEEDTTYYFFARFKGNENYNASEISEGTPIKTDVHEPVDVVEEIPAIGDYTDKITVQKRIKDNKAEFTVISENDSNLSEIWLILAEYNGGVLDNVKLVRGTVSDSKIMVETDLPVLPDYKYMLWGINQKPLIEAITKIGKVF